MNESLTEHEIYIGDRIERAIEIIGQESDDIDEWELVNAYADDEIRPEVELRGNYLHVSVSAKD